MTRHRCVWIFVLTCLFQTGCAQDAKIFTLSDWEFRAGVPTQPLDPQGAVWTKTHLPSYGKPVQGFDQYRGWLLFRSRLPSELTAQNGDQLAVDAGLLSDVARVYVNDSLAGELGNVDPYSTGSMVTFVRTVPNSIRLKSDGNYLYLALYTDGRYPIFASENPRVGAAEDILRDYYQSELLSIALLGVYLLVGLYYLFLWSRRTKEVYHLFFGLLCVLLCFYWFFRLGSRDVVFGNHALLRSKVEYSLLFLISPIFSFFLSQFFHGKYDRVGLLLTPFYALLLIVTAFGSYSVAVMCLTIWQFCIMPIIAYYIFYIVREVYRRNPSALYLVPGLVALSLGAVHDILAIRGWISTPMIARFAFPVFILGGALVLTHRFVFVHTQVEELLGNAYRLENFRTELLSIEPGASITELLERILVVLESLFECEKSFAIVPDAFGALHFTQELPEEIRNLILKGSRLHRRTKLISAEFFETYGSVLQMELLKLEPSSPEGKQHLVSLRATELVFQKVAELGHKIAIALPHESEVLGMVFLGAKKNKEKYSEAELSLIKTFQYSITQAIRNKMLFSEISQLKGEAEERVEKLSEYVIDRRNSVQMEVKEKTIVYSSPSMVDVYEQAKKYADANKPVLISGETGTGKELIARAVHHFRNPDAPFIAVNCAAIPENLWESEVFGHARGAFTSAHGTHAGLIERAKGGTLFLDEIGEMPISVQPKMLRLLQERKFSRVGGEDELPASCQFLFATNRSLLDMQREGRFREDLYYRINVFQIHIPPLRDRRAEVPDLVRFFLAQYSRELRGRDTTVEEPALSALCRYSWPGNVRELENCMIQALVHCKGEVLEVEDLPPVIRTFTQTRLAAEPPVQFKTAVSFDMLLADYSRKLILAAMSRVKGNKLQTAKLLGLKRTTLYNKMKELGLR